MGRKDFSFSKRCAFAYSTLIFDEVKLPGSGVLGGGEKKELTAVLELRQKKHHWVVKHLCCGGFVCLFVFKGYVIFTTMFSFSSFFLLCAGSEVNEINNSHYRVYIFMMLSTCCFS